MLISGLTVAVWNASTLINVDELALLFQPYQHAWYTLPGVMLAFIGLGLVLVPIIVLIAATGIAFGPIQGPIYAMLGCLASASTGFAIGRWVGPQRVTRFGGGRITYITRVLNRNGTLAVFLVRKVPAPFTIVNIIVGASTIRFRDFIVGTVLGMGAFVVGLAGFGYQAVSALRDPSAGVLIGATLFVTVPLMLALVINHALRRMRPAE